MKDKRLNERNSKGSSQVFGNCLALSSVYLAVTVITRGHITVEPLIKILSSSISLSLPHGLVSENNEVINRKKESETEG